MAMNRIRLRRWFVATWFCLTLWLGSCSSIFGNHHHAIAATPSTTVASSISGKIWTRSSFATSQSQHPDPLVASSSLSLNSVRSWTTASVVLGTAAMGVAKTMKQPQKQKNTTDEELQDQEEEQVRIAATNNETDDPSFRLPEAMDVSSVQVASSTSKSSPPFKSAKTFLTTIDDDVDGSVTMKSLRTATVTAALDAPIKAQTQSIPQATTHHHHHSSSQRQPYHILPPYYSSVAKARKQPKSRWTEAKLQERYAAIDSVEARAFQILVDLGMVEIHPPLTQEDMLSMNQQSNTIATAKDAAPESDQRGAWQ